MFTDSEKLELSSRFMMILEQTKSGKANGRKDLADLLAETARDFLKGKYNTNFLDDNKPTGMHQTRDSITKDDFKK